MVTYPSRQFGLEPMPTKISDSRWREYSLQYGNQCWELDALPPNELQNIIRDYGCGEWAANVLFIKTRREDITCNALSRNQTPKTNLM